MAIRRTSIHTDGAARGNPGPAAFAYVIQPPEGEPAEHAEVMGEATNNVAEYRALVEALKAARKLGVEHVGIFSDSELLVKQMKGEYRVKNADLKVLYDEAQELARQFAGLTLEHVRREQNKRADELCNLALDGQPLDITTTVKTAVRDQNRAKREAAGPPSDARVRVDAVACLEAAAAAWRAGEGTAPTAEQVWDQLWSVLDEGGVLKKPRPKK